MAPFFLFPVSGVARLFLFCSLRHNRSPRRGRAPRLTGIVGWCKSSGTGTPPNPDLESKARFSVPRQKVNLLFARGLVYVDL